VKGRQRYLCKECRYSVIVFKQGKSIDPYYVIKALQLYVEGASLREIERLLGIFHVSVYNWVKKYKIVIPESYDYHPT
jgi:transposase-like protein